MDFVLWEKNPCVIHVQLNAVKEQLQYCKFFAMQGMKHTLRGVCVRDRLLNSTPLEYDIATSARPDDIKKLFPKSRSVGESFGVMLVRSNNYMYDVATFRSDGPYSDKRHPDQIQFSTAEQDALRRDFTINGMFEDPLEETIIDFVGGKDDLLDRTVKAIGNPKERIEEDHLRMLRAIRFSSRFEFSIESETANAIRECADQLTGISRERIGEEIRKMMTDQNRGVSAWEIQYLGLDRVTFAEESCMNAPTRLGRLPMLTTYATALTAWMIDRHSNSADLHAIACKWRTQILLPNRIFDEISSIVSMYQRLYSWDTLGTAQQKRTASNPNCLSALSIVQCEDRPLFVHIRRSISLLEQTGINPERLISGDDLLEHGIPPSIALGDVLSAVYDAQLEGSLQTTEEAIALALAIYKDFQDS